MQALSNPPQPSHLAAAHAIGSFPAARQLRRRAWLPSTHASSNGVQPVNGQQLYSSSTSGQPQPAAQPPARILRYAGLAADDFR